MSVVHLPKEIADVVNAHTQSLSDAGTAITPRSYVPLKPGEKPGALQAVPKADWDKYIQSNWPGAQSFQGKPTDQLFGRPATLDALCEPTTTQSAQKSTRPPPPNYAPPPLPLVCGVPKKEVLLRTGISEVGLQGICGAALPGTMAVPTWSDVQVGAGFTYSEGRVEFWGVTADNPNQLQKVGFVQLKMYAYDPVLEYGEGFAPLGYRVEIGQLQRTGQGHGGTGFPLRMMDQIRELLIAQPGVSEGKISADITLEASGLRDPQSGNWVFAGRYLWGAMGFAPASTIWPRDEVTNIPEGVGCSWEDMRASWVANFDQWTATRTKPMEYLSEIAALEEELLKTQSPQEFVACLTGPQDPQLATLLKGDKRHLAAAFFDRGDFDDNGELNWPAVFTVGSSQEAALELYRAHHPPAEVPAHLDLSQRSGEEWKKLAENPKAEDYAHPDLAAQRMLALVQEASQ